MSYPTRCKGIPIMARSLPLFITVGIVGIALAVLVMLILTRDATAQTNQGPLACVDSNSNGVIDISELFDVIDAYFGKIPIVPPEATVFSGTGDRVLRTTLEGGDYVFTISHAGEGHFVVILHDDDDGLKVLANEVGQYLGEVLVRVGDHILELSPGPMIIEVSADGDWEIEIPN